KAGAGFYKKVGDDILTLDLATLEYRAKQPAKLPSIEAARNIENAGDRIAALYHGSDKAGAFLRATLGPTLEFVQKVAGEVAYSHDDVDKAMKWGYGWELGPFETIDALAVKSQLADSQLPRNAQPPIPKTQPPTSDVRRVRRNAGASLIDIGDGVLQI